MFAFTCLGLSCAVVGSMYALCVLPPPPYRNPSLFISYVECDEIINPRTRVILATFASSPLLNVTSTVQIIIIPPMSSTKITDVKRDVFDSTQSGLNYLTSDQGVKVSDTDNW